MERDLNFRKLVKMYLRNAWIVILAGVLFAVGIATVGEVSEENIDTQKVFLIYDFSQDRPEDQETKKNTYFNQYQGLMSGNVLINSDAFTDDEKNRLSDISLSVESSIYTITMRTEADKEIDQDKEILEKLIGESEKWMQEKNHDPSFRVETLSASSSCSTSGNSPILKACIGFIAGVFLMALVLFVWFVMDKKIRTEEDVVYYTGVECIGKIKRR